jgi:hypothetical protein
LQALPSIGAQHVADKREQISKNLNQLSGGAMSLPLCEENHNRR